ncbi:YjfB family protein [Virgibacillus necropolis]|uniref:Putative motility protein n=1 Tax=Virgibacillus necropolis TaxID=163877 RepID=A0A221M8X9_9BACI|nr:YjfB family protein [Virgibacillus necropolis]ASN04089.1 putative motility protein [Virgibacillus necropolis]
MDIAALSVVMANQQVQASAGLTIMNKSMGVMEQQSEQLLDMLKTSSVQAPHPSLGKVIDIQA